MIYTPVKLVNRCIQYKKIKKLKINPASSRKKLEEDKYQLVKDHPVKNDWPDSTRIPGGFKPEIRVGRADSGRIPPGDRPESECLKSG